jgi:hypothetical protein
VKKRRENSDFGIFVAQGAIKMAYGSYSNICFATTMVFCVLDGLCNTSDDHRLELQH